MTYKELLKKANRNPLQEVKTFYKGVDKQQWCDILYS
jgi:hypothetical protein